MSSWRILVLALSICASCTANESIAIAFENWDFGHYNSHSYELLIVVVMAMLAVTMLLLIVSLLFKKLFDWLTLPDTCKARNVAKQRRRKENWMSNTKVEDGDDLQTVLVHAELVRMQGDIIPAFDLMVEDNLMATSSQ